MNFRFSNVVELRHDTIVERCERLPVDFHPVCLGSGEIGVAVDATGLQGLNAWTTQMADTLSVMHPDQSTNWNLYIHRDEALIAVNWGRRWGCAGHDNAQVVSLGFDRMPIAGDPKDSEAEVLLNAPGGRLLVDPVFLDYAILLEPGEYALTSFDIMVARSRNEVGHFVAKRSDLIENGKPKAGSFEVKAGEIVYIGNFWLDCHDQPMLWRYYTEGRDGFRKHMAEVRQKYPFIDPEKVTFRLFRTTALGVDYELAQ